MAKVKANPLSGRLNKALQNHANDQTDWGRDFGRLPPGITGGIAELVDAKLGTYGPETRTPGEAYVRLVATVISPKKHTYIPKSLVNGKIAIGEPTTMSIEGLQFSQNLPLCDTQRMVDGKPTVVDLDDNVGRMQNELRKLGADTSEIATLEDLTGMMEALKEAAPRFRFSTWASDPSLQYPEPRTWENWNGIKGVEETAAEEPEEAEVEEEEEEAEVGSDDDGRDLQALARDADGGDTDAATEVSNRAVGCGLDPEDYATWVECANAIEGGGKKTKKTKVKEEEPEEEEAEEEEEEAEEEAEEEEAEEEEEEAEEEPAVPTKGDVALFKPKGSRKEIDVEITAVFAKKQTVNLKRLDDGRIYKDIPWDRITVATTE